MSQRPRELSELDQLKLELLSEQLTYYRRENRQREREDREDEIWSVLARRFGYPLPRRGRR